MDVKTKAKYAYIANAATRPIDFLPQIRERVGHEYHKPTRYFLELIQFLRPGTGYFDLTINIDANGEQARFTLGSKLRVSFTLAVYKKSDPSHRPVVSRIVDNHREPNRELFLNQVLECAVLSSLDKSTTQLAHDDMNKVFSSSAFMPLVRNIGVEGLKKVLRIRAQLLDNDTRISVLGMDYHSS